MRKKVIRTYKGYKHGHKAIWHKIKCDIYTRKQTFKTIIFLTIAGMVNSQTLRNYIR